MKVSIMKNKATCYYCKEKITGPMVERIQVKENGEVVGISHIECFILNKPKE